VNSCRYYSAYSTEHLLQTVYFNWGSTTLSLRKQDDPLGINLVTGIQEKNWADLPTQMGQLFSSQKWH